MHELSLVQSIFSSLEAELTPEELQKLSGVELKIGLLANVEPTLLQNAFLAYQESHPEYARVKLDTELVPIQIHCKRCGSLSPVENYIFKCQNCGAPSNQIVSGEELMISRVVM
ncbi:MAG: hydrogenase maturation nickel metallochaperone HypA [Bacteroidota bacterium]